MAMGSDGHRDLDAISIRQITARQRATWARGDFHVLALQVLAASDALVQAIDPHAGDRVLDVACGSGNAALVAARRYCEVTGIDYVPALLERATMRAAAEGTTIRFEVADAQALPFEDQSFDALTSVFGVMFAPSQPQAAAEMVRVCRPGGTIGLASWTPGGFAGRFFRAHAQHLPPPPGLADPTRWGTEAGLRELFGDRVAFRFETRDVFQYFRTIEHALDVFQRYFGPTNGAFEAVGEAGREALTRDLLAVLESVNVATDGTVVLKGEYLQATGIRVA